MYREALVLAGTENLATPTAAYDNLQRRIQALLLLLGTDLPNILARYKKAQDILKQYQGNNIYYHNCSGFIKPQAKSSKRESIVLCFTVVICIYIYSLWEDSSREYFNIVLIIANWGGLPVSLANIFTIKSITCLL